MIQGNSCFVFLSLLQPYSANVFLSNLNHSVIALLSWVKNWLEAESKSCQETWNIWNSFWFTNTFCYFHLIFWNKTKITTECCKENVQIGYIGWDEMKVDFIFTFNIWIVTRNLLLISDNNCELLYLLEFTFNFNIL